MEDVILTTTINKHLVRVASVSDNNSDSDANKMFVVQIKRKVLFCYYWSTVKTYKYKSGNVASETIQKRRAISYLNKLIESDGKL